MLANPPLPKASVRTSLSNSNSEEAGIGSERAFDEEPIEDLVDEVLEECRGEVVEGEYAEGREADEEEEEVGKTPILSPETVSNSTENVLYQEIPARRSSKGNSPPISSIQSQLDDYAEPQLVITSPPPPQQHIHQPPPHSTVIPTTILPISANGSPLYAQVHKEPRTEIQKIHSTIPNTFKNENLGCMMTTFGTKTPSMLSFGGGNNSNNTGPASGASGSGGNGYGGTRTQLLASSYGNDLNSSRDSVLGGSMDMLSDSGNHSDSWMYPQSGAGRKKAGRAGGPPTSFTQQLNQVLADRERCVGFF